DLAKVGVASSSLVSRSKFYITKNHSLSWAVGDRYVTLRLSGYPQHFSRVSPLLRAICKTILNRVIHKFLSVSACYPHSYLYTLFA
ncbi:hypothetical protein, partial [Pantoea septica]|uniref:hypothetical protein n=1 Tax=Pantoea septica TaxID=472695 RepID=UPI002899BE79